MRFPKIFLILAALLALSACERQEAAPVTGESAGPPAFGDTLIMGSIGDASNLLPVLASDSASSDINGLVYNGLVRYDKEFNIEGELAESWDISPDNLTFTFHLRKGVRWHDGTPFTSADVLYTYQLYVDPNTPTAYAERYLLVKKAEAPDPYTFQVTYEQPLATALISWAMQVLPKHLLEGTEITKSPLSRKPVGTGPFRFAEWVPGEKIVLEANPDYFEGTPYIKRVVYRIIPDQSTMFLELQSGGLDHMGLNPIQYSTQTDTLAFNRRFKKYRYPASSYTYLGYNLRRPLFQDVRVRQALGFAINKQELIDGVLLGLGQVATGPYKPQTWPHNPNVARYPYDPERARKLLAEAGWRDSDGDGVLDREGKPLAFTIVTNQGNDQRIKTGEIIQRRFKEVGVDVKLRVIEWASFLKEFINPGNFDATILGWTIPPDPDGYNVWHGSKTKLGELNFINYQNPEVDDLLDRGRRTLDQAERKKIYDRFQEILAEEQPYCFLYVPDALPVVASRFRGIEPAPAGIMHNFIRWYVPRDEQKYTR
ncbi:peptide-binding protein [Desulfuromonas versatilis]|uniref:Peptide-binding protein n=1 Tax=Desulfuromonas versatilis TaxID=2802975 RepID=A0ABM8HTU3_9BACT|nr:peptide-binding protein [Desulfuromonas versatilis]BCR05403.1 peptide-binding protein [Desulfuromonas versatilis]